MLFIENKTKLKKLPPGLLGKNDESRIYKKSKTYMEEKSWGAKLTLFLLFSQTAWRTHNVMSDNTKTLFPGHVILNLYYVNIVIV